MEKPNESLKLINMFLHPVFLVKNGFITDVNQAACNRQITAGTAVSALIPTALEEYESYTGGYLSLTVSVDGADELATVVRTDNADAFHLLSSNMSAEFRTMSLVSLQIRQPLAGMLSAVDGLFPSEQIANDPKVQEKVAQMNRNLYQLLRAVTNLSAVQRIAEHQPCNLQTHFITGIFDEVMDHAKTMLNRNKRRLEYAGLREDIHCLADEELIARAVYNLVSNAIKFSPANSAVAATLTRTGNKLRFSVQNEIEDNADLSNLHARFMRGPAIEDGRKGIGLGIPLVQYIAASHGGTLLMDQPAKNIVRFTVTIPIRQNAGSVVRSPIIVGDYLGGHNHALVELSDVLALELYTEYI